MYAPKSMICNLKLSCFLEMFLILYLSNIFVLIINVLKKIYAGSVCFIWSMGPVCKFQWSFLLFEFFFSLIPLLVRWRCTMYWRVKGIKTEEKKSGVELSHAPFTINSNILSSFIITILHFFMKRIKRVRWSHNPIVAK